MANINDSCMVYSFRLAFSISWYTPFREDEDKSWFLLKIYASLRTISIYLQPFQSESTVQCIVTVPEPADTDQLVLTYSYSHMLTTESVVRNGIVH